MRAINLIVLSSLALFGLVTGAVEVAKPKRILACDMTAMTAQQRARHRQMTKRLLDHSTRKELADGYLFTIDPKRISVPELADWLANEVRCCPAVDFHVELPASGPLTLRLDGGAVVKAFLAEELGL